MALHVWARVRAGARVRERACLILSLLRNQKMQTSFFFSRETNMNSRIVFHCGFIFISLYDMRPY